MDGHIFNESEMALFFECMLLCAQKLLDTADIVREAMFRQLTWGNRNPQDLREFPFQTVRYPPGGLSDEMDSSDVGHCSLCLSGFE